MIRHIVIFFLILTGPLLLAAEPTPTQRVGQRLEIRDIYIPGGEITPTPRRDREPPLVVRILEVKPAKDGSRYDFEVQGLEPGNYNLAEFLDAPDGTTIPAIPLEIITELPPGPVRPNKNEPGKLPELGGYRKMMTAFGVVWFVGLIVIVLWRKKKAIPDEADLVEAPTLAERLQPLVSSAASGKLNTADRAKLERLIIAHWREKRPEIAPLPLNEVLAELRKDEESAPLLLALETWLHARDSNTPDSEITKLLAPYS